MVFFSQKIGTLLDMVGVLIILAGAIFSTYHVIIQYFEHGVPERLYKSFRQNLGRGILLGLEFLVAGDIIRSITGTPDFDAVLVLVVIVLVRSFLSITFDMEVEGHWPWQKTKKNTA